MTEATEKKALSWLNRIPLWLWTLLIGAGLGIFLAVVFYILKKRGETE